MDLRLLRSFVVLAHELHFGRAAGRLSIAQPALSQRIRALERDVGTALFDRSRHHVTLTAAGAVLLEQANDLLRRADDVAAATRRAGRSRPVLRWALTRSAPGGTSRALLDAYRLRHPDVDVQLRVGYTARNLLDLAHDEVDVAFVYPPIDDDTLVAVDVGREPLAVALPAEHRLATDDTIRAGDLRAEAVVGWPRANGPGLYDAIVTEIWGAARPRVVTEEPDEDHMLRAVADGIGVAVCLRTSSPP